MALPPSGAIVRGLDPATARHLNPARLRFGAAAVLLLLSLDPGAAARGEGQIQLSCQGTLLESRGQAERLRQTALLRFSLSLEAEGSTADQALAQLQARLASVRSALQALAVRDLRVTSPSTWQRAAEPQRAAGVQANLQVSGAVLPPRLQALIRGVGALAGVRLAPVSTEADPREHGAVRAALLREAYQDALRQVQPLAAVIGRGDLQPLEIRIDSQDLPPVALRAAAAEGPPPFNPAELNQPLQRLTLLVRFCAR